MSYAIVTPSFAKDYERCRLLAESIMRNVEGAQHYVLVDGIDLAQFRGLVDFGVEVIDARELMSTSFVRVPSTRLWLTPRGRVLRGWMTQQLRKLAFSRICPRENILFVDSDVAFIRRFDPDALTVNGKTPLFETEWHNAESLNWANQSRRLLDLPERPSTNGYVHPTFWRRSIVVDLLSTIERIGQRPWQHVLANQATLSEYTLYGVFAREAIGLDRLGLYSFNEPLMHLSWGVCFRGREDVDAFLRDADSENVAVMFHSKDEVPMAWYAPAVRTLWD